MKMIWRMRLLTFLFIGGAVSAHADIITFTEITTTASGNLDGTAFSNALVSLVLTGDRTNVDGEEAPEFTLIGTGTVSVAGVGSDTFTDTIDVFVNSLAGQGAGGISDLTLNRLILGTLSPGFSGYDLSTSFGPLTGLGSFNPGQVFPTAGNNGSCPCPNTGFDLIALGPQPSAPVTFSAVESATTVPEPGSIVLLLTVIAAVSLVGKNKRLRRNRLTR